MAVVEGRTVTSDLDLLTGSAAHDLLSAAVATAGGELVRWTARQVDHRPGSSTTVSYRARVRWADREQDETLGASTAARGPDDGSPAVPGVLTLTDGDRTVQVWRFPLDPGLPGLAAACDRATVGALLSGYGVPGIDPSGRQLTLTVRAYRPRRRAVIEVTAPGGRLFLKVLRPAKVQDLHRRHQMLHDAGVPVPRSLGWSEQGVLVLEALSGKGLREPLLAGGPVPDGAEILALLSRLPEEVLTLPRRRSWTENAPHYAAVVGAAAPTQGDRARELADVIMARTAGGDHDEPTHGDLYESQLLVRGNGITGVLDVDSAGPGRRADDVACLLAHVHLLALMNPARKDVLEGVAAQWQAAAERALDPADLRIRVAGVLLSLATGPHRVQQDGWRDATAVRVDLVERWVGHASRAGVPG